jgi:hypothetical protein
MILQKNLVNKLVLEGKSKTKLEISFLKDKHYLNNLLLIYNQKS